MKDFTKICRPYSNIFIKIQYKDGRLSITGVDGPMSNGDARGSCGQIANLLEQENILNKSNSLAEGWDFPKVLYLRSIWKRWHLNDMVPGTPNQMEYIRYKQMLANDDDTLHKDAPHAYASKMGFKSYYDMELSWLEEANLVEDDGYRFGSAWLTEEVPENVLNFLQQLPSTDRQPAWV